jgi:hypothetical protein
MDISNNNSLDSNNLCSNHYLLTKLSPIIFQANFSHIQIHNFIHFNTKGMLSKIYPKLKTLKWILFLDNLFNL